MSTSNGSMIFQFFKDLDLPIYIKMNSEGLGPEFFNFLRALHFERLSPEDEKKFEDESVSSRHHYRCLELKSCTPIILRHINSALESDKYGPESIMHNGACKVYRYKGLALMIWAFQNPVWELALSPSINLNDNLLIYRIVFNRFLSWALAPSGLCGFWGHFTNGGVVIKKMIEAHGEAVFFDVLQKRIIGPSGTQKIASGLTIYKVEPKSKLTVQMTGEQLAAFLFNSTSYFDLHGPSIPVRQAILWLTKTATGVVVPQLTNLDGTNATVILPAPSPVK